MTNGTPSAAELLLDKMANEGRDEAEAFVGDVTLRTLGRMREDLTLALSLVDGELATVTG